MFCYRQFAPLLSGYAVTVAVLGYALLTHLGRYNFLTWVAWLGATAPPLAWARRRLRRRSS